MLWVGGGYLSDLSGGKKVRFKRKENLRVGCKHIRKKDKGGKSRKKSWSKVRELIKGCL